MKNYFRFNLTGIKLFPVWLVFMLLFLAPYIALIFKLKQYQPGEVPPTYFFPLILLMMIIALAITFFIAKLVIENLAYKEKTVDFKGSFGTYIGTVLLGILLSIVTLGIYMAWFIRNIHRFFINNSSYNSEELKFQGKGGKLFVIFLLTIFLPIILLMVLFWKNMASNDMQTTPALILQQLITMVIMIPYMYFVYRWMVNVDYKDLNIRWETDFWNSCGKIAAEFFLTIITIGIYGPLAMVRLYKYFTSKTVAAGPDRTLRFDYDIDQLNDFLFIWGQILLSLITLGIYYPWAFCKIGSRILGKTSVE